MNTKAQPAFAHLGRPSQIPEAPDAKTLDRAPNPQADTDYIARFTAPEFTSICPVTGQPDFAHLVIDYAPDKWLVESKSLKLYLASFRNHGAFQEDCTVRIGKDLVGCIKPRWLRIGGYWFPRGGYADRRVLAKRQAAERRLAARSGRRPLSRAWLIQGSRARNKGDLRRVRLRPDVKFVSGPERRTANKSSFASCLDRYRGRKPGRRTNFRSAAITRANDRPALPALSGMSDAQRKHINDTMAVGSLSLALSQIALPKADNALLKQFIEFEIAEQETVADILKTLQTNGAPTGSIQAPTDAELMQNLDDTGKASVERLRTSRAGSEFDHAYIQYEVEGHRKLLDIQEVYLKVHDNLDQTNIAKLARGMIKEHLTLLTGVQKVG